MENGHEGLKKVANYVAPALTDDGIAKAIAYLKANNHA